jgi:regulatory protein
VTSRNADDPQPELTAEQARDLSLKRLSVREYSQAELRRYLRARGAPAETAEQVVRELSDEGKISDERFTRVVTRHQALRGKGPRYILMKLRQKGVSLDLDTTRQAYADVAPRTELEAARQLVSVKYPGADRDPRISQRAYRGLLSRGFSPEVARQCVLESGPDESD